MTSAACSYCHWEQPMVSILQQLSERERRSPSITTVEMEGRLQVSSLDFHTLRTEFLEEMI